MVVQGGMDLGLRVLRVYFFILLKLFFFPYDWPLFFLFLNFVTSLFQVFLRTILLSFGHCSPPFPPYFFPFFLLSQYTYALLEFFLVLPVYLPCFCRFLFLPAFFLLPPLCETFFPLLNFFLPWKLIPSFFSLSPVLGSYLWVKKICLKKNDSYFIGIISKVGDRSRGRPEGSLFNSYYTEV